VKISSLTSAALFDFSDSVFSVNRGTVSVLSPNGGESWEKGTTHPILWSDNLCENVRIELWKGAAYHSTIAQSVPSNGSFSWTIPNAASLLPGDNYRIKILSATGNSGTTSVVYDFSDTTFTVTQPQVVTSVTVVTPNGGENWIIGCPAMVQWITTSANAGPFKIDLYKNDAFHLTICQQTAVNQMSYTWIPPIGIVPGNNFKVKVSSLASPAASDLSDSAFSITRGFIHVIAPNGGETWVKGTMHPIVWHDNLCTNVRIELWKAGVFNSLIASSIPSNGSFNWTIPNTSSLAPGNDYKIKVMEVPGSNTTTSLVFDYSDSAFSILPGQNSGQVSVVTPNGGENWIMGCQYQIQWVFSNAMAAPVKIELFKNEVYLMTICPQVPAGAPGFTWIPPWSLPQGADYKVKISTLTSPSVSDFSNANFAIHRGNITVVSPNGGETWVKGTMHPIIWNDNLCDNVRIELWKAGAFHSVIAHTLPSNGTFNWTIPNVTSLLPGNDYKVKILCLANTASTSGIVFDYSDSAFSILQGQPVNPVTVVTPNGGESWIIGCPNLIQWTAAAATTGMVKIELYKNNVFNMLINPQVPAAQGNFTWMVPWNVVPSADYKVKITSLNSAATFDFSDNNFSMIRGIITVVSPNGGENWLKGTMHPIVWTDNVCDNVRIELWKGTVYHSTIAQSVPSTGVFNWMIPPASNIVPGNDYKVKIIANAPVSGNTGMVFDFSDNFFTISGFVSNGPGSGKLTLKNIFPNPCSDRISFTFEGSSESLVNLDIFDKTGILVLKSVLNVETSNTSVPVDLSEISNGIYLYVVTGPEGIISRGRLLVQH
jgi:hydrogenase/urease accessory protein HupE